METGGYQGRRYIERPKREQLVSRELVPELEEVASVIDTTLAYFMPSSHERNARRHRAVRSHEMQTIIRSSLLVDVNAAVLEDEHAKLAVLQQDIMKARREADIQSSLLDTVTDLYDSTEAYAERVAIYEATHPDDTAVGATQAAVEDCFGAVRALGELIEIRDLEDEAADRLGSLLRLIKAFGEIGSRDQLRFMLKDVGQFIAMTSVLDESLCDPQSDDSRLNKVVLANIKLRQSVAQLREAV